MDLKRQYMDKLESIGINTENVLKQDYKGFSILSFSDQVDDELLNISVTFFDNDPEYELIIRRKVDVQDRITALENINAYNTKYSRVAFYLEDNEIYAVRSMEVFENDIQEVLTNIAIMVELIQENDID